jgi:hypothetical protein
MNPDRCPYCGDEDVDVEHVLDCNPIRLNT